MSNQTQLKLCRHMEILSNCERFGYLTTSQIQRLHNLGGRRNATRILNDMSEYLSSFREGETVYYLNAKGRKEVGSEIQRKRTLHVQHSLLRNEVYINLRPEAWWQEYQLKWDDQLIIADALFHKNGTYTFLEVDITQSIVENEKKIASYRSLCDSGRWQKAYGEFPAIMYVTVSEHRKKKLSVLLKGLKGEVYLQSDLNSI